MLVSSKRPKTHTQNKPLMLLALHTAALTKQQSPCCCSNSSQPASGRNLQHQAVAAATDSDNSFRPSPPASSLVRTCLLLLCTRNKKHEGQDKGSSPLTTHARTLYFRSSSSTTSNLSIAIGRPLSDGVTKILPPGDMHRRTKTASLEQTAHGQPAGLPSPAPAHSRIPRSSESVPCRSTPSNVQNYTPLYIYMD